MAEQAIQSAERSNSSEEWQNTVTHNTICRMLILVAVLVITFRVLVNDVQYLFEVLTNSNATTANFGVIFACQFNSVELRRLKFGFSWHKRNVTWFLI